MMNWNVDPSSWIVQLLIFLTMASLTHHQMPMSTGSHSSLPKRHIPSAGSGSYTFSFSNSHYGSPGKHFSGSSRPNFGSRSDSSKFHSGKFSIPPIYQHTSSTSGHNRFPSQHSAGSSSSIGRHTPLHNSPNHSGPTLGYTTSTGTTVKPPVSRQEQEILSVYHGTITQVTQTSTKIGELNQHLLNHSLDVVAANVLRFDQYIADVDCKTKDCKYNSEAQVQRIKELLQQKMKTGISHCMSRENNRLGDFEKSIKDELKKYNNMILLQIKNILIICNKMKGNVMQLCLDKSWQICTQVSDKFLTSVNRVFSQALLVYNESNGQLVECLQKDVHVNKKYIHWAMKLLRASNCKNSMDS